MKVSPEEFFMYLTIALIVLVPASARLYRYMTAKQMTRRLQDELGRKPDIGSGAAPTAPKDRKEPS